ncbi:MAG: peptidase S41, partial [Candidatus Latescibacterota bacterium]
MFRGHLLAVIPLALILAVALLPASVQAEVEPHAGMLRYPDISAKHIVFLYANDLWLVPSEGGMAIPLASPPGEEAFPKFSPDGKSIAFMGNYDGNVDIYTLPVSGGVPFRVTHHPAAELITDWTPDDQIIFFAYGIYDYPRAQELFTVSTQGGLPQKLPVPYGANGRVSADGEWLAYTPHSRDHRTWKRYRGGMATDIWLFHLTDYTSKKITDWEGTDTQPMWQGNKIYYLSDAGRSHRLNIWCYDINTGDKRQITDYKEYDVKWPSNGPGADGKGEIVFQLGSELRVLDLASEKTRTVKVTIPGDRPEIRPQMLTSNSLMFNGGISSTGKRVVAEARGNIWTLPAKKGPTIALNRTNGVAERNPSWSPDGKWIAYFSDETGEYQLYIAQSDGRGETRKLTGVKGGFLYSPVWSPDSKWITFWDTFGKLYLTEVESDKTEVIHAANLWRARPRVNWAQDSNWLAFSLADELTSPSRVLLYNVSEREMHKVTSGMFNDSWPTFDREGKYMYLASQREFSSPMYEDIGTTWIYAHTDRLYVIPLRDDVESPLKPKSDDETWADADKAGDEDKKEEADKPAKEEGEDTSEDEAKDEAKDESKDEAKDEAKDKEDKEEPEPLKIDIEGFEQRMIPVPVANGNFGELTVNDKGNLIYSRNPMRGQEGEPSIHILDLDEEKDSDKEKTVISGIWGYDISADGKNLLVLNKARVMAIIGAKADQKMKDIIDTSGMKVEVNPREEWRQIFDEAWRIQRDFFYDPNMHGVNWKGVKKQYEPMLADCVTREDVSYVIREMISELNVGHAYYYGGDEENAPIVSVGMPGCDFELHN